jgi:hypothetical protein
MHLYIYVGVPGLSLDVHFDFEIRATSFVNRRKHLGKFFLLIGKSFVFYRTALVFPVFLLYISSYTPHL